MPKYQVTIKREVRQLIKETVTVEIEADSEQGARELGEKIGWTSPTTITRNHNWSFPDVDEADVESVEVEAVTTDEDA